MKTTSVLLLLLIGVSTVYGDTGTKSPAGASKWPTLVDEPDQTDIFAIPLDEDAEEQEEELEGLEHPQVKK
jgi:hypothetical protein